MQIPVLISACLLGFPCRYDGKAKGVFTDDELQKYNIRPIPVCPEVSGSLPIPRPAAEIRNGGVFRRDGTECTDAYRRGAENALGLYRQYHCCAALLKSNSPSCGKGCIYDGTFNKRKVAGNGITAALLLSRNIPVFTEDEFDLFLSYCRKIHSN